MENDNVQGGWQIFLQSLNKLVPLFFFSFSRFSFFVARQMARFDEI